MKKFLLVSPKNRTVYNFRGDLIRDIRAKGYNVVVTGPNRDHIDRIEALGARFIEIPMDKTGINILSDLRYLWRLFKVIRQEKPDITLGYTIKPVIYGSIAACLAGVPNRNSMITGAGYLFTGTSLKAKILRTLALVLYRIGLGRVHRVIFQNPDDRAEFVSKGLLPASKCRAVNGSGGVRSIVSVPAAGSTTEVVASPSVRFPIPATCGCDTIRAAIFTPASLGAG